MIDVYDGIITHNGETIKVSGQYSGLDNELLFYNNLTGYFEVYDENSECSEELYENLKSVNNDILNILHSLDVDEEFNFEDYNILRTV